MLEWIAFILSILQLLNRSTAQFSNNILPWRRGVSSRVFQDRRGAWTDSGFGQVDLQRSNSLREVALRQQIENLQRQLAEVQSREIGTAQTTGSIISDRRGMQDRFQGGFQPEQFLPPSINVQPSSPPFVEERNIVVLEPPPGVGSHTGPPVDVSGVASGQGPFRPVISDPRPIGDGGPGFSLPIPISGTPIDPRDVRVVTDEFVPEPDINSLGVPDTVTGDGASIFPNEPQIVPVNPSLVGAGPVPIGPDFGNMDAVARERALRRRNRFLRRRLRKLHRKKMRKDIFKDSKNNLNIPDKEYVEVVPVAPSTPLPPPPPKPQPPPKKNNPTNALAKIGIGLTLLKMGSILFG